MTVLLPKEGEVAAGSGRASGGSRLGPAGWMGDRGQGWGSGCPVGKEHRDIPWSPQYPRSLHSAWHVADTALPLVQPFLSVTHLILAIAFGVPRFISHRGC